MRILIQILLILLVISTVSICAIKPDMHKSVIVYNSDYTLVPEEVKVVEKEEIPIMEIPVKPQQTTTKVETKVERPQTTVKKTNQTKTSAKNMTTQPTVNKSQTTANTKTVQKTEVVTKPQTIKIEQPVAKTVSKTTEKTFTPEEIAWNIWRSNLQNKIMQDVRLPIMPNGITFKFTFNVDKYGKISNVQTWSTTSSYTPYAIQYIAPVIRSYQGKDILNFPQGSSRTSTTVTGGWKISPTEKFSTPQDYNDVEKVIKINN